MASIVNTSHIITPMFQTVPEEAPNGYCNIPIWLRKDAKNEIMIAVVMSFFKSGTESIK